VKKPVVKKTAKKTAAPARQRPAVKKAAPKRAAPTKAGAAAAKKKAAPAKKPVASVADLKGLRVRTANANATLAMRAAGAQPQQISFADTLPLLKTGGIDAVLSSGDGGAGDRLMETLTHFTAIGFSMTMSMVTMNLDTWKALPPDLQEAVLAAAAATSERQWAEIVNRVGTGSTWQLGVRRLNSEQNVVLSGVQEAWTLTCESPDGSKVYETRDIVIGRGEQTNLKLGCGGKKPKRQK